jgi:hypothetical protein
MKKFYLFSHYLKSKKMKKIKNIKISVESHAILKKYCEKNGYKLYSFLEKLIKDKCEEKKDIYGE